MATYILLANWTEQGIRAVTESPGRLDAFKAVCEKHGGRVASFFMTMGTYDMMAIVEAPDDAALSRIVLTAASGGNIRTNTLRAFPEGEYRKIVGSLG